jgi:cytochrome b
MVALFVVAYVTGDEIEKVHVAAGYTIAGLVAARIIWGVVGPHHARFSNIYQWSQGLTIAQVRLVIEAMRSGARNRPWMAFGACRLGRRARRQARAPGAPL